MPTDATTFFLSFLIIFGGIAWYMMHLERVGRRIERRMQALEATTQAPDANPKNPPGNPRHQP